MYNRNDILLLPHKKTPPRPNSQGDTIICKIDGVEVDHANFSWEPGTIVYTDGSCKHVSDPEIAVAASAAVQITSEGQRLTATLAISSEFPRSAVVAEHMALFVASYFATPDAPLTVASDCQAVVQGAGQSMESKMNYSRKMGGFWVMIGGNIEKVLKVKAHLTRQEAADRNELGFHAGNELADHCANQALPTFNEVELAAYLKVEGRSKRILEAIEALARADNGSPTLNGVEKKFRFVKPERRHPRSVISTNGVATCTSGYAQTAGL